VITVLSLTHLAELAHIQGELDRATALYERVLQTATDERGRPKPIAGLALIGLGQVARERGELERAIRYYTEGNDLVVRWGKVATISGYLGLARVRQSQGDVASSQEAIRTAEQIAQAFDAMQADDTFVAAHKARLHLVQGNVEAVQRWLDERGLVKEMDTEAIDAQARSAAPSMLSIVEYMILAEVYIAQGRGKDALRLLAPLLRVSEAAGWTTITIKLLSLEALAFQAEQELDRAKASLTRALVLAEPGGFVQTFVEAGRPMESLLRAVCAPASASNRAVSRNLSHKGDSGSSTVDGRRSVIVGEYVQRLLAAFHVSHSQAQQSCPEPETRMHETLFESLSDRELQVLRFLNTHLSSTEIADELYLSVNTVRSHIKNVYSKLDVHGRAEAIARATELDLL
jgi:LuxR family maltose regulon positive regulatory protein